MDPTNSSRPRRIGFHRLNARAGGLMRATSGSSGYDLASSEEWDVSLAPGAIALIQTGIVLDLPSGFEGQVRSRSGLASRNAVFVLNSPGTIDSDYRGEIKVILANLGTASFIVHPGDRIAQLVFMQVPEVDVKEEDEVTSSGRGTNGFGSSGV